MKSVYKQLDKETALKLVRAHSWHHDWEIIPGVRTNGSYDPTVIWPQLQLPEDMTGITLADVGASSGYFSFEANRRGAEVDAFDYRHSDNSGFGLAQHINGMYDVDHHHVNILDSIDWCTMGYYQVVLCMGLLYHTPDPYKALVNCAYLAGKRLIVESYCADNTGLAVGCAIPAMVFLSDPYRFPGRGQPNDDRSNFWCFTSTCLRLMVEDIGFSVDRCEVIGQRVLLDCHRVEQKTRVAELGYDVMPRLACGEDKDDPASWRIF